MGGLEALRGQIGLAAAWWNRALAPDFELVEAPRCDGRTNIVVTVDEKIDGMNHFLAYAAMAGRQRWVNFDATEHWFMNANLRKFRQSRNWNAQTFSVAVHEMGHALGMPHVPTEAPASLPSVMHPNVRWIDYRSDIPAYDLGHVKYLYYRRRDENTNSARPGAFNTANLICRNTTQICIN